MVMGVSIGKSSRRHGGWMLTAGGRVFYPLDPRPEEIYIDDIAHALARQCRFAGHVLTDHYSVAQHSVLVSELLGDEDRELALCGLLHDATEAYLVDVPTPVKKFLLQYQEYEERLWEAISERFGLPEYLPYQVHQADLAMLMAEKRDLMPAGSPPWEVECAPAPEPIEPWSVQYAENEFMTRFQVLGGR